MMISTHPSLRLITPPYAYSPLPTPPPLYCVSFSAPRMVMDDADTRENGFTIDKAYVKVGCPIYRCQTFLLFELFLITPCPIF